MNHQKINNISQKIVTHFEGKYPETFKASGLNFNNIQKIVSSSKKLDHSGITKIIEIIDNKIKNKIYSNNRRNQSLSTGQFKTDTFVNINIDKYLNNFNPMLNDSHNNQQNEGLFTSSKTDLIDNKQNKKSFEDELISRNKQDEGFTNMNNDMNNNNEILGNLNASTSKISLKNELDDYATYNKIEKKENDPYNENFPIRSREKDLLNEETREFDYYIVIDSKDRNRERNEDPNGFVIDFSPASSGSNAPSNGYVERGFGNVSEIELLDVILLDTSELADSSDAGEQSFPYLLVNFDEFNGNYYGTNNHLTNSFAILKDYTKDGSYRYYNIVGGGSDKTIKKVFNPRINLNKITTNILLPDGTPFDFGSSSTTTSNSVINVSFRVKTLQKNLSTQFINKSTY